MNKKVFLIIAIIVIMLILMLGLFILHGFGSNRTTAKNDLFNGYVLRSGYISKMNKSDAIKIISSYSKLEKYCDEYNQNMLLERYTKDFFENQSLAIIYEELTSGEYGVEFINAIRDEDNVKIEYKIIYPDSLLVTSDMSGYLIIVEIDKDIDDIVW
ncbi:MAG: hypothetical protein ACI4U9_04515 [Clostridia bacterium]